jgi:hypothetical protein
MKRCLVNILSRHIVYLDIKGPSRYSPAILKLMLMNGGTIRTSNCWSFLEMADPNDLQEAADAIHGIRGLPAVQRHKELEEPLRQAEEWARKEYRKVRERNGDPDAGERGQREK